MKAEYLVSLEWPDDSTDDIDLHLLLPDEKMVNFRSREVEHAMLDHDDVGTNGVYWSGGKLKRIREHKEIVTLRAVVPGTYVANVQVYRAGEDRPELGERTHLPFPVKVRLARLNPRYDEIAVSDVTLSRIGEQKTAFEFTIGDDGDVAVDRDADVPFIPLAPTLKQG